ncbi:membrane hypothetical protein [Candidatus Sulfobium mesophilum]|uniref:Uncharacterized protein n=1 Tax=Candidatus Sulfobium mesophilum TaxID=2016548 RepID=A0A2U3QEV0_9BACT|nr:membrane hypothetical protein [Candidatus Sulfobium mesophilum]
MENFALKPGSRHLRRRTVGFLWILTGLILLIPWKNPVDKDDIIRAAAFSFIGIVILSPIGGTDNSSRGTQVKKPLFSLIKSNIITMKCIAILVLSLLPLMSDAQDMKQYLDDARQMANEGKYKEALEKYIWYHEHALEYDRAQAGVRLSFALSYWKYLGTLYPPALTAFIEMRDKKIRLMNENGITPALFMEAAAFNRTLNQDSLTFNLLDEILQKNPEQAKRCYPFISDQLFNAGRYDLLSKLIQKPMDEFRTIERRYAADTSVYTRIRGDMVRIKTLKFLAENTFVDRSVKLIRFSLAVNDVSSAKEIQAKAIGIIDDKRIREAVPSGK